MHRVNIGSPTKYQEFGLGTQECLPSVHHHIPQVYKSGIKNPIGQFETPFWTLVEVTPILAYTTKTERITLQNEFNFQSENQNKSSSKVEELGTVDYNP